MRGSWVFPTALLASWRLLACTGEDAEIRPGGDVDSPVGELGGKCFADQKCKEGLECADGIVCIRPRDMVDASDSADGDSDASLPNEGGACADEIQAFSATTLFVQNDVALSCWTKGEVGCRKGPPVTWECDTAFNCSGFSFTVACNLPSQCGSAEVCCVNLLNLDRTSCPPRAQRQSPTTSCRGAACASNELKVCDPSLGGSDCAPHERCRRMDLTDPSPPSVFSINVCLPAE